VSSSTAPVTARQGSVKGEDLMLEESVANLSFFNSRSFHELYSHWHCPGIIFGAVWLLRTGRRSKNPRLWVVGIVSAFLTVAAVFYPAADNWLGDTSRSLAQKRWLPWLLVVGIPQILVSGLVQEGAKIAPVAVYWWRNGKISHPAWAGHWRIAGADTVFEAVRITRCLPPGGRRRQFRLMGF
jgi:hypothetical protein